MSDDNNRKMEIKLAKAELRAAQLMSRFRKYHVTVGNIGTVYHGHDGQKAEETYAEYRQQSMDNVGRAAGESVILFAYDDILKEHVGHGEQS